MSLGRFVAKATDVLTNWYQRSMDLQGPILHVSDLDNVLRSPGTVSGTVSSLMLHI